MPPRTKSPRKKPGAPKKLSPNLAPRLLEVEDMMVAEVPLATIKAALSAKWSITPRQVNNYHSMVLRQWKEERAPMVAEARAKLRRQASRTYREAMAAGKHGPAVGALRLRATLDGVATERVEHSGPGGGPIPHVVTVRLDLSKLTDEELDQLDRIARKLDDAKDPPLVSAM